ncbi:hypothetical protein ARZXY2_3421 [Arthrobacter sp. ZXY-2]|nr:hypothetical protein ARZXY2_3421 [Arthrobacter sp. ZXY-2]
MHQVRLRVGREGVSGSGSTCGGCGFLVEHVTPSSCPARALPNPWMS